MGVRHALLLNIKQFLHDYRKLCPQSTVFSKLHYLEEHIVKFVPKWKVGPGMMGEHGGESIYHQFNLLRNRFSSIPEAASRSILSHTRRAHLTDCHSVPEPARKKAKKGLKVASLELMILHGMTVFDFSSKKKNDDGPGLKIW